MQEEDEKEVTWMPLIGAHVGQKRLLIFIASLLLISVAPVFALDREPNRQTLRGLQGVRVLIEDLEPEIERSGLTKNQLQKDVEGKLRDAGIKTLTQEECSKTPGEPYLYVNINLNAGKAGDEKYSYSVDIGVIQGVRLQRDPRQKTYAVTWSTGGVGSIEKEFVSRLSDSVEDLVNVFIKAYLSVNPRKK
jgi:hypothetical protein